MAKHIIARSSLESSLESAKRFGASADETKRIHGVVTANTTQDIRSFEVTFDHDADDQLAVWIKLFVNEDFPTTHEKISDLNRAATTIRSELLKEKISYWPYVVIRSSS